MNHTLLKNLKHTLLMGILFSEMSCTPKEEPTQVQAQTPTPTASPAVVEEKIQEKEKPAITPVETSQKSAENLAELISLKKNVDYRLSDESIWKPASPGDGFNRNDAVQTQEASQAQIKYKSGAQIDLKQNSLIIFDADPGSKKKINREDRVIFKKGEMVGSTKSELWVFTQAGLVQIKPSRGNKKPARAKISMPDTNKVSLKVDTGSIDLVYSKNNKYEKLQINNSNELIIDSSQINFTTSTAPIEATQLQRALTEVKSHTKANLIIDNPKEDMTSTEVTFVVSGRVEGIGGQLLINGELVSLTADSKFTKKINLTLGANLIVFQFIRSDSSVQFLRRNIKLSKSQ